MPLLQMHLELLDLAPDAVEDACFALGALSVTLGDAADSPILEPAPGATPLWPQVRLAALFDAGTDPDALTRALRRTLGRPALAPRYEQLADRVWEREWLKDFRPMRFGRRLWICPGGMPLPADAYAAGAPPVVVELDPGLAFGTGTHATTALCLDWLDGAPPAGLRVFDVGCGSGILAIAALKLGARAAVAMDIDPQALLATRENAARNGVGDRLAVRAATQPWEADFDVVLANILAEPLIELAPRLAAATRPAGAIALSGLLAAQAPAVASAFAPWFDMDLARERDGWALLAGRRRD